MKNILSLLSILIFVISVGVYISITFFTGDFFSGTMVVMLIICLPTIGIILAFNGQARLKYIGIIGNLVVVFLFIMIPLVASFFWNEP